MQNDESAALRADYDTADTMGVVQEEDSLSSNVNGDVPPQKTQEGDTPSHLANLDVAADATSEYQRDFAAINHLLYQTESSSSNLTLFSHSVHTYMILRLTITYHISSYFLSLLPSHSTLKRSICSEICCHCIHIHSRSRLFVYFLIIF